MKAHTNPGNGFRCVRLHYTADPVKAVPAWRKSVMRGMPKWAYNREYEIDFESIGGMPVYPEFADSPSQDGLDPGNVIRPFDLDEKWLRYRVIDPGFRNPFCCLWFAVTHPGWMERPWPSVIVYREHYQKEQRTDYHKRVIHQYTGRTPIEFTVIDPEARVDKGYAVVSRPNSPGMYQRKTYQQELLNPPFSIPTVPFMRMRSEYAEIEIVGMAIKRRQLLIFDRCRETIREHRRWTWKERPNADAHNPFETPIDKDNHACDCVKYFFNSPWEGSPMLDQVAHVPVNVQRLRGFWGKVHTERKNYARACEEDLINELGEETY